jgi:hypothetical protein
MAYSLTATANSAYCTQALLHSTQPMHLAKESLHGIVVFPSRHGCLVNRADRCPVVGGLTAMATAHSHTHSAHTAGSSLGVRIYMASSSSVCAEWGHREHQWATATALSKCIVCAARTALPSQPPTRRPRRACDSGTTYIGTPSEPLGAVAQPLPGPVSSARPCAALRLRASAIGIRQLRSWFVAVAPRTHVSARCSRQ